MRDDDDDRKSDGRKFDRDDREEPREVEEVLKRAQHTGGKLVAMTKQLGERLKPVMRRSEPDSEDLAVRGYDTDVAQGIASVADSMDEAIRMLESYMSRLGV